ncbi:hypothetical protein Dimus_023685 [Dionaea muscipula]
MEEVRRDIPCGMGTTSNSDLLRVSPVGLSGGTLEDEMATVMAGMTSGILEDRLSSEWVETVDILDEVGTRKYPKDEYSAQQWEWTKERTSAWCTLLGRFARTSARMEMRYNSQGGVFITERRLTVLDVTLPGKTLLE